IKNAGSTREMLEHLDELITRNEVELRKTRQDLARLELSERAAMESIKSGKKGGHEKEVVLLQIKRTRGQMESLKLRSDILNKNIELHLNLVGKIQAMEAMDLRGIEQPVVERVMLEFEEGMEKFNEAVHTGEGVTKTQSEVLTASDREELAKLEKEILGEAPSPTEVKRSADAELAEIEREIEQSRAKEREPEPEVE
ncbi:MAG: hypothetical protein OEY28_07585, partial [Nitrospira sp.]|nr:hypothetical protein [Nitrospira sp.]